MFAGMPIAFALGAVATAFMIAFMPAASLDTITQNVYEEMASITLLSIRLFILKGSAIGRSAPGRFSMRPFTPGCIAAWHFAAAVDYHDPLCGGGAIARPPVPRSSRPGSAAGVFVRGLYGLALSVRVSRRRAGAQALRCDVRLLRPGELILRDRFELLPRVLPFVILPTGVALHGGFATPSETAGLGAVLALRLIASITASGGPAISHPPSQRSRESTLLMLISGMSLLYSYVMSYLYICQSTAEWIVALNLSGWVLLTAILVMVVVLGFFLPPVSIETSDVPQPLGLGVQSANAEGAFHRGHLLSQSQFPIACEPVGENPATGIAV
jgi:C4-dicarboxylate transporter, DctM subunit